jgi:hypothetical protein
MAKFDSPGRKQPCRPQPRRCAGHQFFGIESEMPRIPCVDFRCSVDDERPLYFVLQLRISKGFRPRRISSAHGWRIVSALMGAL